MEDEGLLIFKFFERSLSEICMFLIFVAYQTPNCVVLPWNGSDIDMKNMQKAPVVA